MPARRRADTPNLAYALNLCASVGSKSFSRGVGETVGEGDRPAKDMRAPEGEAPDPARRETLFADAARRHAGLVGRIALSYERDEALRRELVQDIWLALWVALERFRGDSSLKTFIAAIAQKRSISHVTRRAREPRQEPLDEMLESPSPQPDEIALGNDMRKHLVESIRSLPLPQREAIVLSFEGFSYAEIGEVLGISANAALLRCQRARTALKALMGKVD